MSALTGSSGHAWQPVMTADTTTSSYWLNWRVLLCSVWILMSMVFSSVLISKYEGPCNQKNGSGESRSSQESAGILYDDEVWKPCLKGVHPAWLLAFRVIAFVVLLLLLIAVVSVDGGGIFYFYTQWTFALVTIYFGLGSILSVYGCYQYHNKSNGNCEIDAEHGSHAGSGFSDGSTGPCIENGLGPNKKRHDRKIAGFWSYVFQIIFQMNAGAVMLTDCIFWFVIVPFLTIRDYNLNFLVINMHSINAVFLLGDTALNCLRFPWFRIAYFFLWTSVYVIFQWIAHACISLWWPYPFLDLSSSFSPLWYSSVALLHIPCYGIFFLIMKLKHYLFSKWFPQSYKSIQ